MQSGYSMPFSATYGVFNIMIISVNKQATIYPCGLILSNM